MWNKRIKRKPYTIVEILLVLGITLVIVGLSSAAISAMTGKRGLNGAASMMSSQVNLARSTAVAKNRYVALLIPEPFAQDSSGYITTRTDSDFKAFFCNRMRLCFVKPTATPGVFDFDNWIEGSEWTQLPPGTCAHPVQRYDLATLNVDNRKDNVVDSIGKIEVFASGSAKLKSSGIVFAPNGRLASHGDAMIQVYSARPNTDSDGHPDMRDLGITSSPPTLQSSTKNIATPLDKIGNLPYRRWCVCINKLTGRARVTYAQPEEQ